MQSCIFATHTTLPAFRFTIADGWVEDIPLKRESKELFHTALVNPALPGSRIEIREYLTRHANPVRAMESARARFAPDELYDVSYDEEGNAARSHFRVGDYIVIQTSLGFETMRDDLLILQLQLSSPLSESDAGIPVYTQAADSVQVQVQAPSAAPPPPQGLHP